MITEELKDIMIGMLKVGENGRQIMSILNKITEDVSPLSEPAYLTEDQVDSL